ncbi:MAG: RNA polymerase sigma factor [Planctomycetota bacterium]|nr:MAG: RNA polymerase sigma factor [Planctomycetota bacterium]
MTPQVLSRDQEQDLLQDALQGNRRAFGELVQLHQARAMALAVGIVGNREEARDLYQEACLKSFKALRSFVPGRPFFPWFYRILRNACIQHLRSRRVRRSVSLQRQDDDGDYAFDLVDTTTPSPEELVERDARSQALGTALTRLSPADREILTLKHFDGLSYKEIAEALSIPIGTVMSRLHVARRRLRKLVPELA